MVMDNATFRRSKESASRHSSSMLRSRSAAAIRKPDCSVADTRQKVAECSAAPVNPASVLQKCAERRKRSVSMGATPAKDAAEVAAAKRTQKMCTSALMALERKVQDTGRRNSELLFTRAELHVERAYADAELRSWARTLQDCQDARTAALAAVAEVAGSEAKHSFSTVLPLLLGIVVLELGCTARWRQQQHFVTAVRNTLSYLSQLSPGQLHDGVGTLAIRELSVWILALLVEGGTIAYTCAQLLLDFLLDVAILETRPGDPPLWAAEFLAVGGPPAFKLLLRLAKDVQLNLQAPALQCLVQALLEDRGPFNATPELVFAVVPHCCTHLHEFDERPHLCLELLLELAARPSASVAPVVLSPAALVALLSIVEREETAGALALAAVLLITKWMSPSLRQSSEEAILRSFILLCRRVDAQIKAEPAVHDSSTTSPVVVLDALAFLHLRVLLSDPLEVQDELLRRGTRLGPLFSGRVHRDGASGATFDQQSMAPVAAGALGATFNLLTVPLSVAARPRDLSATVISVHLPKPLGGIAWARSSCDAANIRRLLLTWLSDYCQAAASPGGADILGLLLNGSPSSGMLKSTRNLSATLLFFLEMELHWGAPVGAIQCLSRFMVEFQPFRREALHRIALFEQLMTYCDGDTVADAARRAQLPLLPEERAHACAALMALMDDSSDGTRWAMRVMATRGPERMLRWAACHTVDPAAAYKLLRVAVRKGGRIVARDVWRLCPLVFNDASALRAVFLYSQLRSASKQAESAATEWRCLCACVLAEAICTAAADPYLGSSTDDLNWTRASWEPQALLTLVEDAVSRVDLPADEMADLCRLAKFLPSYVASATQASNAQISLAAGFREQTPFDAAAKLAQTAAPSTRRWLKKGAGLAAGPEYDVREAGLVDAVEVFLPGTASKMIYHGEGVRGTASFLVTPFAAAALDSQRCIR